MFRIIALVTSLFITLAAWATSADTIPSHAGSAPYSATDMAKEMATDIVTNSAIDVNTDIASDMAADMVSQSATVATDSAAMRKEGFINRIVRYFSDANKPKKDPKAFDISFIGGPYYSSETSLAIGIVASGTYLLGEPDSTIPRSVVALGANVSISGFTSVRLYGTNIFPKDRWRIDYYINFQYLPTHYWGIGYANGSHYDEYTKYTDVSVVGRVNFLVNCGRGFYLGPTLNLITSHARKIKHEEYFYGQPLNVTNLGPGLIVSLDRRDNLTAPESGYRLSFLQQFYPRFLGNGNWSFSASEVEASAYQRVWRGGVLAERVRARWAYGDVAWASMSTFGGSHIMRGYYEGQYRDKFAADICVELRQKVWRRSGIALWGNLGAVATDPGALRLRRLLPGGGIGYRWEFKKHSNVRVDFGVGRHTTGVVFSINEAF